MAQVVTRRPLTAKARVQSQNIPYDFRGWQSGTGAGLSPSTYVFLSIIPPLLHSRSFICHRRYIILATERHSVTRDSRSLPLPLLCHKILMTISARRPTVLTEVSVVFLSTTGKAPRHKLHHSSFFPALVNSLCSCHFTIHRHKLWTITSDVTKGKDTHFHPQAIYRVTLLGICLKSEVYTL